MTRPTPAEFKPPPARVDCVIQVRIPNGSATGFRGELAALADLYAKRNGQHVTYGEAVTLAVRSEIQRLTKGTQP